MTKRLKAVDLGNGPVWLEVDNAQLVNAGSGDLTYTAAGADKPQSRIADLGPTLRSLMHPIRDAMTNTTGITEIVVEVSLGFKGEVGFFVAKGEANTVVKVSAKLSFPPSASDKS